MSRVSRVPYHQNVYDLLLIEPGECPDAARMIAEHEAQHGPLLASVREWYLVPNIVPLDTPTGKQRYDVASGTVWHTYSEPYDTPTVADVLRGFAAPLVLAQLGRFVEVLHTWDCFSWYIRLDGSADPPVWNGPDRYQPNQEPQSFRPDSDSFSRFVMEQFAHFYLDRLDLLNRRPIAEWPSARPYRNGLWFCVPDEPFSPPVIDFLMEQFGEPERAARACDVTTYTFRPDGGTIRVTADAPALSGGLSAWWVHADTPARLAEFAALLVPWGTLRDTLRADTDAARAVLTAVRASGAA